VTQGDCEPGDEKLLGVLETLWRSSSKGLERKRSSSERKDVARSSGPQSDSEREVRRGHDGKAQLFSDLKFDGLISMGEEELMPYEP
jgi:hypothetical protein